jgi:DNA (cytosine-5)-methyltransferase 1
MAKIFFIDLFCGAGGVTTGIMEAGEEVIACINHDAMAIKSHLANHPECIHYTEDIRTLDLSELTDLVNLKRNQYPDAIICLWASLECTNFSKAKGGKSRDADSRTLAEHLFRYIERLNPDSIWIENVEEFMSWGPLDENGKPVSKDAGRDYMRWVKKVKNYGYQFDYRVLNAADYGAHTSRKRYFAQFLKPEYQIVWPEPTHAKTPFNDIFGKTEKWKPVKEVLDFSVEGKSIFNRKKPLSDKTYERIYAGLVKYIAGGKKEFLAKYYSGRPAGKVISTDGPAGAITCIDGHSLVVPQFMLKYNSTNGKTGVHHPPSVDEPCPTIACQGRLGIVNVNFMQLHYGNGFVTGMEQPCPTLTTKDRAGLVTAFIDKQYTGAPNHQSIEQPSGTIMPNDKHALVNVKHWIMATNFDNVGRSIDEPAQTITANRKHHYLVNPQWGGNNGDIEKPCCTIIARQDKAPLYLLASERTDEIFAIPVYDDDTEIVIKIKEFMSIYGIVDIKMRMLMVEELLKIQGFSETYILHGTQADKKKFIGNSVPPKMVQSLIQAFSKSVTYKVIAA